MKLKHLSILASLSLLLCFCLGIGTAAVADESGEEAAPFSMEIQAIPANVDGWGGTTGSRELNSTDGNVTTICYFDYSETNANFIKFNLWQFVRDKAPAGIYKVTLCYSTGDEAGKFVMNIRGKEHILPITRTADDYVTFVPGTMSTYEYFDFSDWNQNDILLYNGANTANPDLKSIRLDYVADYAIFHPTEAETAELGGGAALQTVQSAAGGKVVKLSSGDTATFGGMLGEEMQAGSYRLNTIYMNGGSDDTLTVNVNGTEYATVCPATSDNWDTWKEGYTETLITLKGDGTDEIVYSGGAETVWLDSFMLTPADLVKDITEIPACDAVTTDFSTPFDKLDLPETVTVTLKNGDTAELAVNWVPTGYTVRKAGTYSLSGRVVLATA